MILHTLFYIITMLYKSVFKFLFEFWSETIIITRIWHIIATNAANLTILVSFGKPQSYLTIHSPDIDFNPDRKDVSIVLLLLQVVWVVAIIIFENISTMQYTNKFFKMLRAHRKLQVVCWYESYPMKRVMLFMLYESNVLHGKRLDIYLIRMSTLVLKKKNTTFTIICTNDICTTINARFIKQCRYRLPYCNI